MSQEIDYTKVLADLEARRAAIEAAIVGVKAMLLGQGSAEAAPGGSTAVPGSPRGDTALPTEVAPGVFHGMSVSEAARTFLEMKKQKQRTRTICDAMLVGGIESDARDFYSNVYTTLARNKDFFKRGKYWMLTSWDPRRAAAAVAATKPVKKTRRGKKGRKATAAGVEKNKVVDISSGDKAATA